ncbi:pyruvate dehydrogenase (acetyl-transferring) E1 component subunit alpha [Rarobacter incanus]|uniref:Pyruvate dehydrogenase E1 component alpha subunit n=1 Tax=Rarobacter incanus TaxID=153494 RepID=A0A542SQ84_9MICO|nr:pyruvate dehydrogenase (acetyl-transferring) E1 component subunit alpha [Rarobacter incanus]TQK76773.1 pyruvate dehydrogenase E1 component alpha subunit [Rarobacter incanus]
MPAAPWQPSALTAEPLVQLVDHAGQRRVDDVSAPYEPLARALDADALRTFYRDMTLTRRFDEESTSLQRQGELALFTQSKGQEAAQIGSAHAMRPQDWAFPAYREHGVLLVRGVPLRQELHLFRGIDHGGWDTEQHRVHLNTLVIGSHALHATGYAMGMSRDGLVGTGDPTKDEATVVYFGDGATSQGDVSEAFNFAAVNQAPIVFFCQNNQWAISVPGELQYRGPLSRRGEGFGVPGVRVDGNDALAVYAVTKTALDKARAGGGPTLIEAVTFRRGAHTTSDDPTRYRSETEEKYWAERDPIDRIVALLKAEGAWSDSFAARVQAEGDEFADELRTYVRSLGRPDPMTMFDNVYTTPHAINEAEREWMRQYDASFKKGGSR